jgi:predicted nuclease of predicted toxin-antitoxin system
MAWQRLENPDRVGDDLKKKTRLLVDESLGPAVAEFLRSKGYNAVYVGDVGLAGRDDDDIFAYAWREQRMIWTHDRDFLNDKRFPEHRNPGLVVLPGGDGDDQAMGIGLATAVQVFGMAPSIWQKTKSIVSASGEMSIRRRHLDTGKIETTKFRMTGKGYAEFWEPG